MTKVIKVNEEIKEKMIDFYKDKLREKIPPYAIFQAKDGDTVITMYTSGKVMFQGNNADIDANMWGAMGSEINSIQKEIDSEFAKDEIDFNSVPTIGSDEVGTGDYFGPIVVASAYVSSKNIPFLINLGVRDSKNLRDDAILKIVPKMIKKIPYEATILSNKEYNNRHSVDVNMNKIKAVMHNKVLNKMVYDNKFEYDYIVVDQFASEKLYFKYLKDVNVVVKDIVFLTKAENKCLSVACASMISRYIFLKEFDKLSDKIKTNLPKGAGEMIDKIGKKLIEEYGEEILENIAKLNFKNTIRIKEED